MHSSPLFEPVQLGALSLPNRFVMPPMTRSRSLPDGSPGPYAQLYYTQRASAGLIITEGTVVSAEGVGGSGIPGLWTDSQVQGWKRVTDAVHRAGGTIVTQLWHTGRASHPVFQPGGKTPVGPSPIAISGSIHTDDGRVPFVPPRPLDAAEVQAIVADFAKAGENALAAGFDGVEVHAANGYLIDQFLQDSSNQRTDRYGGSIENRARLLLEVVDALIASVGADRIGVRISPSSTFQDMTDSDPEALFGYLLAALATRHLAYLHLVEPGIAGDSDSAAAQRPADRIDSNWVRKRYPGKLIATGGYEHDRAVRAVESGTVDAVGFGRAFLANPDLPERFQRRAELREARRATFFGGDNQGYVDYPSLAAERMLTELRAGHREPVSGLELHPETEPEEWHVAWAQQQHSTMTDGPDSGQR